MKKLIDIDERTKKDLQIIAIERETNLKNLIEDILVEYAEKNNYYKKNSTTSVSGVGISKPQCCCQLILKIMSKHTKYTEHYMGTEFIEDNHTYKYVGRSIMSGKFMYETVI